MKYITGFFKICWSIVVGLHNIHMGNIDEFYRLFAKKVPWLLVALFYIVQFPFSIALSLLIFMVYGFREGCERMLKVEEEMQEIIEEIEKEEE